MSDLTYRLMTYTERRCYREGFKEGALVGATFAFALVALAALLIGGLR